MIPSQPPVRSAGPPGLRHWQYAAAALIILFGVPCCGCLWSYGVFRGPLLEIKSPDGRITLIVEQFTAGPFDNDLVISTQHGDADPQYLIAFQGDGSAKISVSYSVDRQRVMLISPDIEVDQRAPRSAVGRGFLLYDFQRGTLFDNNAFPPGDPFGYDDIAGDTWSIPFIRPTTGTSLPATPRPW